MTKGRAGVQQRISKIITLVGRLVFIVVFLKGFIADSNYFSVKWINMDESHSLTIEFILYELCVNSQRNQRKKKYLKIKPKKMKINDLM